MNKPLPPVDFDDNPEWTEDDFAKAKPASQALVRKPGRPVGSTSSTKQQIALRVDVDVVETFKNSGAGWQTRMNEALRTRVDVTYSRALKGWLVSVNRPTEGIAGRAHHIIGKFPNRDEAIEAAEAAAAKEAGNAKVKVWENA